MKCCKIIRIIVAFMIFTSVLCNFSLLLSAEQYDGRITIDFKACSGLDTEMRWDIFKVADIVDSTSFKLTEDFQKYPIKFDVKDEAKLSSLAYTLSYYAISDSLIPYCSKTCKPESLLIAENLPEGYYLIQSNQVEYNSVVYSAAPALVCVADGEKYGTDWQLDITVIPKLGLVCSGAASDKISCVVKAQWTNTNEKYDVKVSLFKDGIVYDTITLNANNDWQYVWSQLPNKNEWTIVENDLPENFYVNFQMEYIDADGNGVKYFEITNSYEHPTSTVTTAAATMSQTSVTNITTVTTVVTASEEEKLPQTGMLLWPIPVLAFSGLIFIGAGWYMIKKQTKQ